jgi:hypothetical protein
VEVKKEKKQTDSRVPLSKITLVLNLEFIFRSEFKQLPTWQVEG